MKDGIKDMSVIPNDNFIGITVCESKHKLTDNFQLYQKRIKFKASDAHLVL
jgi:hypothetical protein